MDHDLSPLAHLIKVHTSLFHWFRRAFDSKAEVTTEDNPAYGLSGPHVRGRETKDEYDYNQPTPPSPEEIVYEGVL